MWFLWHKGDLAVGFVVVVVVSLRLVHKLYNKLQSFVHKRIKKNINLQISVYLFYSACLSIWFYVIIIIVRCCRYIRFFSGGFCNVRGSCSWFYGGFCDIRGSRSWFCDSGCCGCFCDIRGSCGCFFGSGWCCGRWSRYAALWKSKLHMYFTWCGLMIKFIHSEKGTKLEEKKL